ncbi:MAG: Fe-S-containing protein [bacterium]
MKIKQIIIGILTVAVLVLIIMLISSLVPKQDKPAITKETKTTTVKDNFLGEKGETVTADSGKILINESDIDDGNMHAFNYYSEKEDKSIYFFVLKAPDGTYRVAANACEVCFGAKKGFRQAGDLIKCDNCGVTYSKNKVAKEKGGCNPGPIDSDASISNGQVVINLSDVGAVAYLF